MALLTSEIEEQFYIKKYLTAAFLDAKGAYDNVDPETIIKDLIDLDFSKSLVLSIYNLISIRYIRNKNLTISFENLIIRNRGNGHNGQS